MNKADIISGNACCHSVQRFLPPSLSFLNDKVKGLVEFRSSSKNILGRGGGGGGRGKNAKIVGESGKDCNTRVTVHI
jgi:hypothetical protein